MKVPKIFLKFNKVDYKKDVYKRQIMMMAPMAIVKRFTTPDIAAKPTFWLKEVICLLYTSTVKMLQELMPNATLLAEDIPVHPAEGIEMLQKMAETEKPDLIIGTSMGGMYTELLKLSLIHISMPWSSISRIWSA